MIKFFRHIRQRLLSENKFSKYLLYAIGEILLVVIGKPCPVRDYISVETIDGPYVHRAVGTKYSGIWILPQSIWSASDLR